MTETELPEPPPSMPPPLREEPLTLRRAAPLLSRSLERIGTRSARQIALRFALIGLGTFAGALLLAAILLTYRQSWARPAGWIVAGATLVSFLTEAFRRSHIVSEDLAGSARLLGRILPTDASDLLSAVELTEASHAQEAGLSLPLVRMHLARVARRAARIDPDAAIDRRPVLVAGAGLAVILTAHLLLFMYGGARVRTAYAYLAGHGTAELTPLFAPEPIAGDITLTYRYPAHMHRQARTVPGTSGDISAPKGTTVNLSAHADRDVERAVAIVDRPGQPPTVVPLTVHGRVLTGELLISEAGDWKLRYTKASGATIAEGPGRPIAIEPDEVPEVRLFKPPAEQEVSGHESITLSWSASDDYGLRALDLVWSTGHGAPDQRRSLDSFKERPRHAGGDVSWSLAELGLQPGDRVVYHLEAFDNDSVSGGQTGKKGLSSSQVLKVFSETEHHEEILKQAGEAWERLVNGLGDRLEEPPVGTSGEKADAQWTAVTKTKDGTLAALATDMQSLAKKLAEDRHAPPEIGRALAHIGTRLFTKVDTTIQARRAVSFEPNRSTAASFVATLREEIGEEEKDVLYLEDLLDHRRLLDLAALARELQEGRQQQLESLVSQYKAAPTEENKQRILAEVAHLKERLNDLYRRMRSLAGDIQDEHLNMEARQMMDNGDSMMSKLDQVQRSLSKGSGDDALKAVADLDKQLSKMAKELDQSAGESSDENKQMAEQLQQLASDLMDVQGDQAQLKKETDQLRSRQREESLKKSKHLAQNDLVKKERDRIQKARKELNAIDPRLDEDDQEENLQKAQDRLSQLDRALQAGDFDEAQEQVHQAQQAQEGLKQRLNEEGALEAWGANPSDPGHVAGSFGQAGKHAEGAAEPTREITEDLDKLMRESSPAPSDAEKKQMGEMGRREASVERRTEDLKSRLDKMLQQTPIAGPEQTKMLQGAADAMGGAHERLGEGDSRGASTQESDAMQKLSQFSKAMQQQQSGGQGQSGGGVPMPFGEGGNETAEQQGNDNGSNGSPFDDHSVEIPSADQSHAPAAFRRDLLDAMKDKAPDKYKEKVRSYYEELVK